MAKYRKKPVVIDAWLLTDSTADEFAQNFLADKRVMIELGYGGKITGVLIKTLEGVMTAFSGDYIIQGAAGELYPCKADIFEQTYELVSEDE